jgi:hypothetical protein
VIEMDNLIDEDIKLNVTKDSVLSLNEIIDDKTPEIVETAEIEATVAVTDEEISINDKELVNTEEEECTALVELKPRGLLVAQTMFKRSIKISIKSFLISLSLGFLNLFF